MRIDNFDNVILRLLTLFETYQLELLNHIEKSVSSLQSCLKESFSTYMKSLTLLMLKLRECYLSKANSETSTEDFQNDNILDITKLKCFSNCPG